jgi:DNA-binding NarL/FixJ family response regulator
MRSSAAVLCHDPQSLESLNASLCEVGIRMVPCPTGEEALELVLAGRCTTLIVDFGVPGAEEIIRMASLLPKSQKPALLAVESGAWPGTGQAFHSGANRILYRPLDAQQVKEALRSSRKSSKTRRKSARFQMKTLVYLECDKHTLPAISLDISEHGLAVQAAEPVPISSDLGFRCVLPGTNSTLKGRAEVIWASDHGRAGMFFSDLTAADRKHLKRWLSRHSDHARHKDAAHALLPPEGDHVSFAAPAE